MSPPNPLVFPSNNLWATHIAGSGDFPDERHNTRLGVILETFANKPSDSIPQATGSAGQAKGAYRFLENPRLEVDDLLQPLVDTTVDACRGTGTLLAIQDSSSANYSKLTHTQGLGKINDSDARGILFHTTIAVRADGVPCGLLHQWLWTRPPEAPPKDYQSERRFIPIEEKESYKWLAGIEAAEAALDALPAPERPRLIHVFDREGDIHEVLEHISGSPAGAVIRATYNRSVAGAVHKAFTAVATAPLLGRHVVRLPARHGVAARQATLELRSCSLTITPSHNYPRRQPIDWTLVEAREIDAPPGVEPLHWLLWTTEPAQTLADVLEILRIYHLRWLVEDFHLTLKSGCCIEDLQLETAERLEKAIVLYSAVALRIVALRQLSRTQPDAPCTLVLTIEQWQALHTHFRGTPPTAATPAPTVKQATLWIGRLGGHLNRKRDGMPGVRTLWRGWRDLTILVHGYRAGRASR
jgi:hypothetical protein